MQPYLDIHAFFEGCVGFEGGDLQTHDFFEAECKTRGFRNVFDCNDDAGHETFSVD